MNLVVIESPYAGGVEENVKYARRAMADSLARGEAPFASHLLYTQVGILDDLVVEQRALGIKAGFAWAAAAPVRRFYVDRGWSRGMQGGMAEARRLGQRVEICKLDESTSIPKMLTGCDGCGNTFHVVPPHCPPST
jgi:hypothetical protein